MIHISAPPAQVMGKTTKLFVSPLQTYNNVLHVYGMHSSKEPIIPISISGLDSAVDLRRIDIYLQQSQMLSNNGSTASALLGDGRSLLFGFSDGSMQLLSWQAKVYS